MSNEVIRVENLSKLYDLGQVGTGTVSKDLNRWWARVRKQDDPYAKIGQVNDRTQKARKDESVWALRDISFSVNQGDVLGIIGRNGAGKSTLLKIISRITTPTLGAVKVKGRIASLLEVGTGFHPEMTGRENVFMNGTLMGMTRKEIQNKFDEIVDFAGVAMYIDTPVKRYSSGMQVRLGFAVAAFLEPEILIVDEVLAVGDAEFQRKAIGRMQQVSKGDGRTVLFVSHSMNAISKLCTRGLLLKNGSIFSSDRIDVVINHYLNEATSSFQYRGIDRDENETQILSVNILNSNRQEVNNFSHAEQILLKLTIKNLSKDRGVRCNLAFLDLLDKVVFIDRIDIPLGYHTFFATIPSNMLVPNKFKVSVALDIPSIRFIEKLPENLSLEIVDLGAETGKSGDSENGIINPNIQWTTTNE